MTQLERESFAAFAVEAAEAAGQVILPHFRAAIAVDDNGKILGVRASMMMVTERDPDALSLDSDPYVLIRPEGSWDEPGPLERSAARPVTSPNRYVRAA